MSDPNTWCAIYLCCLLVSGYAAAVVLAPRRSAIELFGLAACLGPAIMGGFLIAVSLLGRTPSRFMILGFSLAALLLLVAGFKHRAKVPPEEKLPRIPIVWLVIGIGTLATVLYLSIKDTAILPTLEWDAFAIWQLKAKILTDHALLPKPAYFFDVNLSYSHLRYPVLVPMISAGSMAMTGHAGDDLAKVPYLLMYLGMAAIVFSAIRRMAGGGAAVVATGMLLTTPITLQYGGSGTAELALTAFFAASVVCLLRWQAEQKIGDLVLTGIFSAAMTWTKNEGVPMAAINGLTIIALTPKPFEKRKLLASTAVFAGVALLYLPWFIYARDLPRTDEDYGSRLVAGTLAENLYRLPFILKFFIYGAGYYESDFVRRIPLLPPVWHDYWIFWYIPPALALLNWKSFIRRPAITLWILLFLQLAVYIYAFVISIYDPVQLLPVTVKRLLMHLTPIGALLIAAHWPIPPKLAKGRIQEISNTSR